MSDPQNRSWNRHCFTSDVKITLKDADHSTPSNYSLTLFSSCVCFLHLNSQREIIKSIQHRFVLFWNNERKLWGVNRASGDGFDEPLPVGLHVRWSLRTRRSLGVSAHPDQSSELSQCEGFTTERTFKLFVWLLAPSPITLTLNPLKARERGITVRR